MRPTTFKKAYKVNFSSNLSRMASRAVSKALSEVHLSPTTMEVILERGELIVRFRE